MKNSDLIRSASNAINNNLVISLRLPLSMEDTISETDIETIRKSDEVHFDNPSQIENYRNEMNKAIEKNIQNVAAIRTRMKNEKKEIDSDLATTMFELELANGFMKIRLRDFKPSGKNSWDKFKVEFKGDMDELNKEFKAFIDDL